MLSHRLLALPVDPPSGIRSSYLLACARTRAAAVVDPEPATTDALRSALDERGLNLRWVLRTRSSGASEAADVRLSALARSLGLRVDDPPYRRESWPGVPCIAPAGEEAHGRLPVRVGAGRVHVAKQPRPTPAWYTAQRGLDAGDRVVEALRCALGAFHVRVLPWGEGVAFAVADRLVVPALPPDLPAAAASLPPETLVHTVEGGHTSVLGRTRRAAL